MLGLVAQAYEQPPSLVTLSAVLKKGDFQDTPLTCSTHFPLHNITDLIEMQIIVLILTGQYKDFVMADVLSSCSSRGCNLVFYTSIFFYSYIFLSFIQMSKQ